MQIAFVVSREGWTTHYSRYIRQQLEIDVPRRAQLAEDWHTLARVVGRDQAYVLTLGGRG